MARPWHLLTSTHATATTTLFVDYVVDGVRDELAFVKPRRSVAAPGEGPRSCS